MISLRRFRYLLIGILSLNILLSSSCSEPQDQEKKTSENEKLAVEPIRIGGIYRIPLMNNPATLDPAYVQDQYGLAVTQQIFEGLVRYDSHLMILPALAESWQMEENGKAYRFFLRRNARFHNNRPVKVEDVVFSIQRLLQLNPPPAILPHLIKIEGAQDFRGQKTDRVKGLVPDSDYDLLIRLDAPYAPLLIALGMYQAAIVPKEEVIRLGKGFGRNPIGSGSFRFITWEKDQAIRIKKYSDYYGGSAFLDEIHYKIYPGGEIDQVLADFRDGNLEEMPVYGKTRQELSTVKELQWFHRPSLSLLFYGIKGDHPVLKNPDFRKALSLAIDREKLVGEVYKAQFEPASTVLPPGMPAYHRENRIAVYDITAAQDHLKRSLADLTGDLPTLEIVSGSKSAFAMSELNFVRDSWAKLGISVKTKFITDWTAFGNYLNSNDVQIYRYVWFADMPDPDSFLYPLFASESPVNFAKYQNKKVDQMLLDARGIIDPVKRAQMYQQIEALVLKASPIIPLFYLSIDRVYQDNVQGVKLNAIAAELMSYHRIWLKPPSP
jgi:ABC-type transport system substrate-binding protein